MAIKWKGNRRFKPEVVLQKIASIRTVTPSGTASFSGFGLEDCLPALQSMLEFPAVAKEFDQSTLVWRGLTSVPGELTPVSFLKALNAQLSKELSTRNEIYYVLTSISVSRLGLPNSTVLEGCRISYLQNSYPKKYKDRIGVINKQPIPFVTKGLEYCNIVVASSAKSPHGAITKALKAVDLQRALWCLMCNPRMQIIGQSWVPINSIRLGAIHTVHNAKGTVATETIWFEPNYIEARPYVFEKPGVIKNNVAWALKQVAKSPYRDTLIDSLLRYVRAFDENNQNTAFIRLWSAIEALVSPGHGDYDRFVQRCAFLFQDGMYHIQLLEHLREYRNRSVHAGDESDLAKTHCYQLQIYFSALIWFHIRNADYFISLDEANAFLDLPADRKILLSRQRLIKKALKFINPASDLETDDSILI